MMGTYNTKNYTSLNEYISILYITELFFNGFVNTQYLPVLLRYDYWYWRTVPIRLLHCNNSWGWALIQVKNSTMLI